MDQVTQQNAALVVEAAAASESMLEQAAQLANVVSVFKIDGVSRSPSPPRAAPAKAPAPRKLGGPTPASGKPATAQAAKPAPSMDTADEWEQRQACILP
ncbi:hypothetical protein [Massilia yuzhufengensis]|uniref:Methyl-accepting chemotaxis protein n=1 Tax=Massilia yuzhufengensis TaxID=1164594 RepID=A0A1I1PXL4_9BURK|nr:methyl-accepting chemotaxis protein [Massilia yuzhufengensis]